MAPEIHALVCFPCSWLTVRQCQQNNPCMNDDASSVGDIEHRRLAAIMFTDIVGFSRQMGADEARMLRLLEVHNQLISQSVTAHHGHVIKTIGDAFLVDFPSVVHAVQCAQTIQTQLQTRNIEHEKTEQIHIRIGIHLGDIVQKDGDVFGDGVNIASRLQSLAEPNTICISQVVYQEVSKKLDLGTVVSLGKPKLKNIAERFQVYALLPGAPHGFRQKLQFHRLKFSRHMRPVSQAVAGLLLVVVTLVAVRYLHFLVPNSQLQTPNTQPLAPNTQSLPLPDKPSLAVLPFTNMSGDPEQEYFSDGMTDDLITDISKISGLSVKARNSVFTYKGKNITVAEVRRALEVRYVLEGSVRRIDDRVRINAQLVDATTDTHLWAERYDREWKDIFALQDEIRTKIILALKVRLTPEEHERFKRAPTDNLEAYDLYLRGLAAYGRFTQEGNAQARQFFERAIALDPEYAGAYTYLGWTHWIDGYWEWSPRLQAVERAFAAAQRAVALNDSLAGARALLGAVHLFKEQYEEGIAEMERAIALDPNSAEAYVPLAEPLDFVKRPEAARESVEAALRRNPHYPGHFFYDLGVAYFRTGRYQKAIVLLEKVRRLNPQDPSIHTDLAITYLMEWVWRQNPEPQMLAQALENAQRAVTLRDYWAWPHLVLSQVFVWQKRYEEAIAEAEQAVARWPSEYYYANLAEILNFAGQPEKAIAAAEHALRYNPPNPAGPLTALGWAYYLQGRIAEAIDAQKRALSYEPKSKGGHLNMAILYGELGQEEKARAEAAEFLRLIANPNFSLEVWGQRLPYKDPAVLERHIAALRKAGLK